MTAIFLVNISIILSQEENKMKKKYTRKQITEAIAYWKKQLKTMNESIDNNDFYLYPLETAWNERGTTNYSKLNSKMTIEELMNVANSKGWDAVYLQDFSNGSPTVAWGTSEDTYIEDFINFIAGAAGENDMDFDDLVEPYLRNKLVKDN